jgi:uncharacterized tellurite resistance protein B-like protein
MSIWKFLGLGEETEGATKSARAETDTVRKIVARLEEMEPEKARYLAAFAYILSRAARADLKICEDETRSMERIVMEEGKLPEDQAIIVVQMAKTQSRLFGGTENFLVTREFNKIATREQKIALLHCLFAVSAADLSISTIEDNEVSQIARELGLDHREFISVRSSYREHLAVLKKQEPGS